VPCVGQFTVGEPLLRAQSAPKTLVRFAYSDPGLSYYGNGLIATEATIKSSPDLVRRFTAATVKGMKAAFANPAEAAAIMNKHHPEVAVDVANGETTAVAELAEIKGKPLAEIDPSRIQATLDVVNGAFKLKSEVTANEIYEPGFVPK
jgi:NitT/TauT family transport system substrate-binding protein